MSKKQESIKIEENLENSKILHQVEQIENKVDNVFSSHEEHMELKFEKERVENFAEQLEMADNEKAEIEKKYSTSTQPLESIEEQEREQNIAMINKLYVEGMAMLKSGEKELAIAKLQQAISIDSSYYLAWFGLLQVHTDNLQDLHNIEDLAEIYDNSILKMDDKEKIEYAKEYLPQLQEKIDRYRQAYKELEQEDEKIRQEYQPKYNRAWKKCRLIFWIVLASTVLLSTAMASTWPFLHFVSGNWIAYQAIILTVLTGISLILFLIFSIRFTILYAKKNFCQRLGNSIYGEEMRKIAKECEKYQIVVEDLTIKVE